MMSSSKESSGSGSDDPFSMSIKSLPDPIGYHRMRQPSVAGSRFSDSASTFCSTRPLSVTYKTERTTTGLFRKKMTIVDSGSFIKSNGFKILFSTFLVLLTVEG